MTLELTGRVWIRKWCKAYIARLRAILKRTWPGRPDGRSPCHTCAFNPGTDAWPGFESTVTNLMFAIEDGNPFYCHDGHRKTEHGWLVDPAKAQLCAGYEAIADVSDLKAQAAASVRDVGRPPRCVTWDENRGLTYPKGEE